MFCKKCGTPIEGEQTLCSKCAEVPETPEVTQTPADETFTLYSEETTPAPKPPKKKKTGLVIGISAAVVVAIAAAVVLCWNSISAFWGRTLQAPEDYFASVESAAIADYSADLAKSYGQLLDSYSAGFTSSDMQIQLTLGDEILTLLESTMQQQGIEMDMHWLSNIRLSLNTNIQDDAMQMALNLGLSNTDLLSADVIVDAQSGMVYMAIPELNPDYISADVSYELDTDELSAFLGQTQTISNELAKDMPSEEEIRKLLDTYVDIVLSGITNVEKQTETVTVNGESQKMVVLTAKIKEKDLLNIAEKIIKKAEKDTTVKKFLNAYSNYTNATNEMYGYSYEVDLYQQFQDSIPYALESLDEAKEDADSNNYVKLRAYVDMQNNVRGHELDVYTDGEKVSETMSWMTMAKGNTVYTEAVLDGVVIEGEKTEKNDISEGFYVLTVEDVEIGKLEFENMTETSGTLRFIPSEEVLNEILSGSGIPTSLLGGNVAFELSCEENTYSVNILVGSKVLLGLDLSGKASNNGKVTIPANAIESENVMQWLANADFASVLSTMEEANVPQELVDAARSYVQLLQLYMG